MKRIIIWIFSKRIFRYIAWKTYESGLTGNGTTLLDVKPSFSKPWIPKFIRNNIDKELEKFDKLKRDAFKDAYEEVLGEEYPS